MVIKLRDNWPMTRPKIYNIVRWSAKDKVIRLLHNYLMRWFIQFYGFLLELCIELFVSENRFMICMPIYAKHTSVLLLIGFDGILNNHFNIFVLTLISWHFFAPIFCPNFLKLLLLLLVIKNEWSVSDNTYKKEI